MEQLQDKHRRNNLPGWPEDKYGAPVAFLRSALFRPLERGSRKWLDNQEIASWPNLTIKYKGEALDQADLDVWLEALRTAQIQGSFSVTVSVNGLLKSLNRSVGGSNKDWLHRSIERMMEGTVKVWFGNRHQYGGHLINSFTRDTETGRYLLRLDPDLSRLFLPSATWIDRKDRIRLGRKQLAKALHAFISSHRASAKDPLVISSQKLHKLFGSGYKHAYAFRRDLRQTLNHLQELGCIHQWRESPNHRLTIFKG